LAPGWEYSERASQLVPELTEAFRAVFPVEPVGVEGPPHLFDVPAVATGHR